ncbi:hypothetical protein EJ06DRAFT_458288, partial [Trichodelitschia bisporula]
LSQFLTRTLRITTTDQRMFTGQMKCTDRECNIILSNTHEYRPPTTAEMSAPQNANPAGVDPASRYVGLVVVPGKHIVRIEAE